MNTKHIIWYFATIATMSESKEKLVSIHIPWQKGEVALPTDHRSCAMSTYRGKKGGRTKEPLDNYGKVVFPILSLPLERIINGSKPIAPKHKIT